MAGCVRMADSRFVCLSETKPERALMHHRETEDAAYSDRSRYIKLGLLMIEVGVIQTTSAADNRWIREN